MKLNEQKEKREKWNDAENRKKVKKDYDSFIKVVTATVVREGAIVVVRPEPIHCKVWSGLPSRWVAACRPSLVTVRSQPL